MLHRLLNKGQQPDRPLLGVFFGAFAFFLFTVMNGAAKYLSTDMSVIGVAFYRNLIGTFIILSVLVAAGRIDHLQTERPLVHAGRGFLGVAGIITTFFGYALLPMAQTTVILFSTSLMLPILGIFLLKEKVGIYRWSAIVTGFFGVVIACHPGSYGSVAGAVVAFIAATIQAFGGVVLRLLGRTEDVISTTFFFMLTGMLILLPVTLVVDIHVPADKIWLIFVVGIAGTGAQLFLAGAYRYAAAALVTPLNYTSLIWAALFDMSFWGIVPSGPVMVGGVIVVSCNLFIIYREQKKRGEVHRVKKTF